MSETPEGFPPQLQLALLENYPNPRTLSMMENYMNQEQLAEWKYVSKHNFVLDELIFPFPENYNNPA